MRPRVITSRASPYEPRFAWCAYREGEEELQVYGYGPTEEEARADLARIEDEEADWLEGEAERQKNEETA